eukprot:RCo022715
MVEELAHGAPRDSGLPRVVVTGGCGFLGHHVVEHFVVNLRSTHRVVVLDKLSYASQGLERLRDTGVMASGVRCYCVDLTEPLSTGVRYEIGSEVDFIVHLAAETHIPSSVAHPVSFLANNVFSTLNMLEYARSLPNLKAFFLVGSFVFGSSLPSDPAAPPALDSTAPPATSQPDGEGGVEVKDPPPTSTQLTSRGFTELARHHPTTPY